MQIGFIGLGQMGAAIAANLRRAGHELTVWNRSAAKAQDLVSAGALLAGSPREAAAASAVVFTMLADDAALEAVLAGPDGLFEGLAPGALHVSLSTIGVTTAQSLAARHAERGQRYLSAPVFGRPEAAAAAKLFVVTAGDARDLATAAPLFEAMGQRSFHVGDEPAHANLVKLCGNFAILASVEILAETMALADKGGVPRARLLEVLTGTLFDAPVFRNYGAILVQERYRPAGFAAPLGLKDMRLVGQAADATRVPMPLLGVLRDHLLQAIAQEGEDIDWSGIARSVARNAGM